MPAIEHSAKGVRLGGRVGEWVRDGDVQGEGGGGEKEHQSLLNILLSVYYSGFLRVRMFLVRR